MDPFVELTDAGILIKLSQVLSDRASIFIKEEKDATQLC